MPAGGRVEVTLKVAGIHWWYRTRSHAAELTAGYYNTAGRDGYNALIEICAEHGAGLTLTCVEMCDGQHPPEALCGPEGLLRQVCQPRMIKPSCAYQHSMASWLCVVGIQTQQASPHGSCMLSAVPLGRGTDAAASPDRWQAYTPM